MKIIPYGKQSIDSTDIKKVQKVFASDWITQGPKVKEFENALADFCGAKYAVAVSSGTAALHLACLAAGLKKGDGAITTPITFIATSNSVIYTGAKPVFADINFDTINIDPKKIKSKINKKTKAILPVHFAGLPCQMNEISKIASKNKLIVIEDASHALGAEYESGKIWIKVGSCRHSDMTVFSFHPVKHITTGEGGAITTNSEVLYKKLLTLRSHGIYKQENMKKKGSWYYEMRDLGFNYRITDFQCALGLSQLGKLNKFLKKRQEIANLYKKSFKEIKDIQIQEVPKNSRHAYHLFIIKINPENTKITRKQLFDQLHKLKIYTQVHYIPVHLQPYCMENFNYKKGDFPQAEKYYSACISLPLFPDLEKKEVYFVINSVKNILNRKISK